MTAQRERACELRRNGLSVRQIAAEIGASHSTVGDWVRDVARGPAPGHLKTCPWCGDLFFTTTTSKVYCCRAHGVAAAGNAYRERGRSRA